MVFVEQALGLWIDAERDLLDALGPADHPRIARHRAPLDASLAEIRGHLGTLEVRSPAPGARVRVNAAEPVALPLAAPLRVLAGTVRYEVAAEGYAPTRRTTAVSAGALTRDEVVLVSPEAVARGAMFWGL